MISLISRNPCKSIQNGRLHGTVLSLQTRSMSFSVSFTACRNFYEERLSARNLLRRLDESRHYPQALVLVPSRLHALTTGGLFMEQRSSQDLNLQYALNGKRFSKGHKITEKILIGTPGRVLDLSQHHHHFNLSNIQTLIVVSADVFIQTQGYHDQCIRIRRELPTKCHITIHSDTHNMDVREFASKIMFPEKNRRQPF